MESGSTLSVLSIIAQGPTPRNFGRMGQGKRASDRNG